MDAETAQSVIDDAFEGLGTPDCLYQPPGGGSSVEGLVLILHRPSAERLRGGVRFDDGGFRTSEKPAAVIWRVDDLPADPPQGARFTIGATTWLVGENEAEDDDVHGLSRRISVTAA